MIESYPFPSWLELASQELDKFGTNEIAELQEHAVIVAIHDQVESGLVIPCHYDMFEFKSVCPEGFIKRAEQIGQKYHLLKCGERLDL